MSCFRKFSWTETYWVSARIVLGLLFTKTRFWGQVCVTELLLGQIHHDSHTECKHYSTSRVRKHGTQVDLLRFSRNQSCSTLVNTVPGTPKTVSVRRRQGREHVRKRVCLSAMSEPVKTEKLFSFMTTLETFTLLQKCYMRSSITSGFRHSPSVLVSGDIPGFHDRKSHYNLRST